MKDYIDGFILSRDMGLKMKDVGKGYLRTTHYVNGVNPAAKKFDTKEMAYIDIMGGDFCQNGCWAYLIVIPRSQSQRYTMKFGAIIAKPKSSVTETKPSGSVGEIKPNPPVTETMPSGSVAKTEPSVIHYIPDKASEEEEGYRQTCYNIYIEFLDGFTPTQKWDWAKTAPGAPENPKLQVLEERPKKKQKLDHPTENEEDTEKNDTKEKVKEAPNRTGWAAINLPPKHDA
ncbi:hypothetical protein BDP27DRAFT_1523352 [Rhodocollybia butyracea]|uniref:Uncharacterized protein n=1 Tax=Rhodocollybia butyracea TaxID=206335 RepID=A0A9P5PT36_9AGAR|nr:hypothetical protein BDP27DRAFT_1523352 [Rhodocollybia butyracea]